MRPRHTHDMQALLIWYDAHQRRLPWRVSLDAYRVWLSEVMLQQTTVPTVLGYYPRFLERWPNVEALARASQDEVLAQWAGLGYYSRARKLHACAKLVAFERQGRFPETVEALQKLPGIGPYTAKAVAAIAFKVNTVPMDGNIERVTARLFAITTPLPAAKPMLQELAQRLAVPKRPGDLAQALMDLGSGICTPTKPACPACPLKKDCQAFKKGIAENLPARVKRAAKPVRHGVAFIAERKKDGAVLLRKRPEAGLLGGMLELPGTPWQSEPWTDEAALAFAPSGTGWRQAGLLRHVFTHFTLMLEVRTGSATRTSQGAFWAKPENLSQLALPTLFKKALKFMALDV